MPDKNQGYTEATAFAGTFLLHCIGLQNVNAAPIFSPFSHRILQNASQEKVLHVVEEVPLGPGYLALC